MTIRSLYPCCVFIPQCSFTTVPSMLYCWIRETSWTQLRFIKHQNTKLIVQTTGPDPQGKHPNPKPVQRPEPKLTIIMRPRNERENSYPAKTAHTHRLHIRKLITNSRQVCSQLPNTEARATSAEEEWPPWVEMWRMHRLNTSYDHWESSNDHTGIQTASRATYLAANKYWHDTTPFLDTVWM